MTMARGFVQLMQRWWIRINSPIQPKFLGDGRKKLKILLEASFMGSAFTQAQPKQK